MTPHRNHVRLLLLAGALTTGLQQGHSQAQVTPGATASPSTRTLGTVESSAEGKLRVKPDKGEAVYVQLVPDARVLQLPPGSTDLKTAQPATVGDIAAGDRVLVLSGPGDGATLMARRVILMKSAAISARRDADQADWQRRGLGGIVSAVNVAAGTLEVTSGSRRLEVTSTPTTVFRRYSDGSVRFEDAVKSTISDVHAGDQVRVRGARAEGGTSVAAEEVVSGTFSHVSGTLLSVDTAARVLTLQDLKTKKLVTVDLNETTSIRTLPPDVAARLAARSKRGAGVTPGHTPAASATTTTPSASEAAETHSSGGERGDLSQIVAKLPETPQGDLHKGDAVMIVGMPKGGSDRVVAVTLLAGVAPILAANPNGEADSALGAWNLGGGVPEGGGGSQ